MYIPNDVSPGQPISAKDFNAVLRLLRATQLSAGPGLRVQRSSVGVTVALASEAKSPTKSEAYRHPFLCTISEGSLSVEPGFVNGQTPTINGVALDAAVKPTLNCYAGANVVYIKTAGTINTETGVETIARAVIEIASALPEESITAYAWTAYQTLTTFTYDAENPVAKLTQYVQVNLKVANFGIKNAYFA